MAQQLQQIVVGQRAASVLDLVDQGDEPAHRRAVDAVARADFGDRRDLHVHLRPALAHRQIAPDAGMGFRVRPVERDHRRDRASRGALAGVGREGGGIEAVEAERIDALGHRHPTASPPSARQAGSSSGRARQSAMPFCPSACANSIAP